MESSRTGRTVIPGQVVGGQREGGLDKMLEVVAGAPDPAASHAFLLVVSGSDPGRLHVIDRPEMIIGRSRYADIHISERALSQQHCKIARNGELHRLYDLGSTNGTFVNEVRVQQVDLRPGDSIRTGETLFTYMSGRGGESPLAHQPPPTAAHYAPPPVTALAPIARPPFPGQHQALMRPAPPGYADLRPQGYAGVPQVIAAPGAGGEGADLVTWILRGIEFSRRYWLSILLFALLGAGLGAGSYKVRKPPAKAEFEISLIPMGTDNPVEMGHRMNFEFFRDAQNNFGRLSLIKETLREVGETDVDENRLRSVQADLEFVKEGQYSYRGSYTAATPEEAIEYLEVHLKLYKDAEIEKALRQLRVEATTLSDQVSKTEEDLKSTDEALRAFKQENLDGLPDQAGELYSELIQLGSRRSELSAMATKAQNEVALSRKQLSREDPEIEARIEEAKPFASGIADVKKRIAALRSEGKGEQHPKMVEAKEELASLEALRDQTMEHGTTKIVKSRNPIYKGYRQAVDEAETNYKNVMADLGAVTKDYSKTEELVEKLPRLQAEYAELMRTYAATERTHAELFQKLISVEVRLELEHAQAAARYDVITPPNAKPVSKMFTILKRGGLGLVVGLFLGIGLGVLRDLRRYISGRLAATRA